METQSVDFAVHVDLIVLQKFLARAEFFHLAVTQGWTDVCGGGLYWEHSNHYKNAIPNELFLMTSTKLHFLATNSSVNYLDWAQREWAWFESAGDNVVAYVVLY